MKKILIILILLNYGLMAHTLWLDDTFEVHQGHMHKDNLYENTNKIDKDELSSFSCLKEGLIQKSSHKLISKQDCSAIFITLHAAYYTETPSGTQKVSKDKVKTPLKSWLSVESVKRLYRDETTPFSQGLDLVVRNTLSKIDVGDKARLTIYFEGKPLKGAIVANGHKTIGISDKDGYINVKIRTKGLQTLKASYTLKGDGLKCNEIIHTTTLNFEVKR